MMAHTGKRRESHGVSRMKSSEPDTRVNGKPVTTLKLWMIRLIRSGIILEGYKNVSAQDLTTLQNWRSSEITTRIDKKTLATRQGSIYQLKGNMDEEEAADAGLPADLIEAFASGFPENWEELIQGHIQRMDEVRRRQSTNTGVDEEKEGRKKESAKGKNMAQVDLTMPTEESAEYTLNGAKKRMSIQKGRKSLMHHVQPDATIEEEEEEEDDETEEKTPARRRTPARSSKTSGTPVTRKEDTMTPGRGGKGTSKEDEEEKEDEQKKPTRGASASRAARTPRGAVNGGKKTPETVAKEEVEVFATPDETPRGKNPTRTVAVVGQQDKKKNGPSSSQRRVSLDAIPKEIMEKSVPLSRWVIAFVRGGTPKSIFPHFQFLIRGLRPENLDSEWKTSVIQKVVPPYIMFTSTSIYRLDGPMDVDQSTEMGFPPPFITDFLMGFPDDWEERLETFFNKTFGPPPQPRIVEVMSDGETCKDDDKLGSVKHEKMSKGKGAIKKDEPTRRLADEDDRNGDEEEELRTIERQREEQKEKRKRDEERDTKRKEEEVEENMNKKMNFNTPRNTDGQKIRAKGLSFPMGEAFPSSSRKRKEPTPSSPSHSEDESETDEDEDRRVIREGEKLEKRMREEEEKKARKKLEDAGVRTSRSGRLIRTPRATWAGEAIVYDVHGNAVEMKGVTTTTKMTVGKTNDDQTELMAAHYGFDSPLTAAAQKERSIAPPTACLPKTPAPKKSKAEARGYSDDETDKKIYFDQYMSMLAAQAEATPAFNLTRGKRRLRVVESSDSEAEAAERRKAQKRKMKEERRRLRESEEEESSDDGYRRRGKPKARKKTIVKKEANVKKEKQVKKAPIKKRQSKKEESEDDEEMGSDLEIEHDDDAVTFNPSEDDSSEGRGNGYSDDDLIQSEEEEKKISKKEPVKRAKVWKKEELLRLKLAIQAADPSTSADGWENVAKSLGGGRTAEECKKSARERLKMPREEQDESDAGCSDAESGSASEDEERRNRRKGKLDGITAKKGTAKYAVEMENKKRELIMGGSSQEDFFKNAKRLSGVEPLPSVGVFDANDSLLSVLDDEEITQQPKARTTKTARMAAAPATPRLSELQSMDSPGTSAGGSARRSASKFIPSPVVDPADVTRYVHHFSRTMNMSLMSKSMADQSRMMPPKVPPRGRNVAKTAAAIDKVEKSLMGQRKARENMDDLDEDDENDDNVLPAQF